MFICVLVISSLAKSDESNNSVSLEKEVCENGFILSDHCLSYCPTGFSSTNKICSENPSSSLNFDFYQDIFKQDPEKVPLTSLLTSDLPENEARLTDMGIALRGLSRNLKKRKIDLAPIFTIELSFLSFTSGTVFKDQSGDIEVSISKTLKNRNLIIKILGIAQVYKVKHDWVQVSMGLKYLRNLVKVSLFVNEEKDFFDIEYKEKFDLQQVSFDIGSENFFGVLRKFKVFQYEARFEMEELGKCEMMESMSCLLCYDDRCFQECCLGENGSYERRLGVIMDGVSIAKNDCPVFYSLVNGTCISNNRPALVFSFDTVDMVITDTYSSNISLVSSAVPALFGTNRGKYFDGLSNYFELRVDNNYLCKNLTLYYWIKTDYSYIGSLFSGINFQIVHFSYMIYFNYTRIGFSQNVDLTNRWSLIKIKMMSSGLKFTISSAILENNFYNFNFTVILNNLNPDEVLEGLFSVGKSLAGNYYKGWMYLLVLSSDSSIENSLVLSTSCSSLSTSTHPCPLNYNLGYFLNASGLPEPCPNSLLNCKSSTDISICVDPNCKTCSSSNYFACKSCTNLLYKGYCFFECPYLTETLDNLNCNQVANTYSITFEGGIKSNHSSLSLIFSGTGVPKSIKSRGTYFPPNSFAYSPYSYYMTPEITQMMWVKVLDFTSITIGFVYLWSFMYSILIMLVRLGHLMTSILIEVGRS